AGQAGVKQVAVLAREDEAGDKRLVAYLVLSRELAPTPEQLKQALRQHLPEYMVPSALVILDKLPLNANGKVDRKALPSPEEANQQPAKAYVAPRTPIEEVVANIWAEVLRREQVGVDDNFFDLGGHSLLATQVVSRVREHFNIELPLRSLFESPTVSGLSELIATSQAAAPEAGGTIVAVKRDAYRVRS
ncbi:MAG TPA: phosphopantetheine-binding protein, partial [Terriglobales bacterium]